SSLGSRFAQLLGGWPMAGQIESTRRDFMRLDSGAWLQDVAENVDRLTIEQLLDLHDLVLAPLCPATKPRIVCPAPPPPRRPPRPPARRRGLPSNRGVEASSHSRLEAREQIRVALIVLRRAQSITPGLATLQKRAIVSPTVLNP